MLYSPITPQEVQSTIKENKSTAASLDNLEIHPSMLKQLGPIAIHALSTLFSLCLRNGKWIWNSSNIIFLKKDGKSRYDKAGSYRPISISSYIGKLMERILARRLETYLTSIGLMDSNQEGFSKGRNTVRYLHRLTAGIKGDIKKKLTVLCLFIDFEKAFDSVWKKGLIVKLWKNGVHGCYLGTIDSFLSGRTVSLLLNGFIGPVRTCLDYGLPQGSVLSPILFKFYVFDMEDQCTEDHHQIKAFKFADDGTIKVTGKDLNECLFFLEIALQSIGVWTGKWRMVINCSINKTEVICFNCEDSTAVPTTFQLCGNTIQLTDTSKVLGVTLDRKLNFKQHCENMLNNLVYRWVCISRYANRNWGLNQRVLVCLVRTVIFSSLFYSSLVWQTNANLVQLNKLWYKVAKSTIGAVFNVQHTIAEVILGVPPLSVTGRVLAVKHYLKALSTTDDIHRSFLFEEVISGNPAILSQMKDAIRFIKWKQKLYPRSILPADMDLITNSLSIEELFRLSKRTCYYSRRLIDGFTEFLWQESLQNKLQLEGWSHIPKVSVSPLPLQHGTSRETEVLIMSLFYENNLLNSFLYKYDRSRWTTPLCICGEEEQTALHLLTSCHLNEEYIRNQASHLLSVGNGAHSDEFHCLGVVSVLNCSRDPNFIRVCKSMVETESLCLRKRISLPLEVQGTSSSQRV